MTNSNQQNNKDTKLNKEFEEWENLSHTRALKLPLFMEDNPELPTVQTSWEGELLAALKTFSPQKLEEFSYLLLKQMGIHLDANNKQSSTKEHTIQVFGHLVDPLNFRTNRIAIMIKRLHADVTPSGIQHFQKSLTSSRADYGIFITTTRFNEQAKQLALTSNPPITLIDGIAICELVAKYKLFVTEVTTYELGDYYKE